MSVETHHVGGPGLQELVALINLGVIIAIVYFAGRRGIKAAVAQRAGTIATGLNTAREELAVVEARLAKAKTEYENLATKKQEVLQSVRLEGERVAKQILEETQKSADQILADAELSARSELSNAAKKIRADLVDQTFHATLAQLEGSTAKAHEQKTEIHDKLFEKFVGEIPTQLSSAGSSK